MKKVSKFYVVYFAVLFVAISAILVGMIWLWGYLDEYESARPKYVAEDVFETYFAEGDFTEVSKLAYSCSDFEGPEELAAYVKELCSGKKLSYNAVSSKVADTERYIVKADDKKIAAFTLKKGDKTTERGFEVYETESFELYVAPKESVTVLVPAGAVLKLNSVEVPADRITTTDVTSVPADKIPEGLEPPTYDVYTIDGLLFKPEVSVVGKDGELSVIYNEKESRYETLPTNDETLQKEHSAFILDAVKEYARYLQRDSYIGAVSPYFDTASDLYYFIATVAQQYAIDHVGDRFEDEYTGEFYSYDEDTFSCHVSVNQILTFYTGEEFVDPIDMTVYLHRVGDKFLIFDWYLTEGEGITK